MSPTPLTPNQEKVLALIAAGYSATAAAQQAGIHRNTVANWLKVDAFRKALAQSRYEKQLLYWDQAQAVVVEALNHLRTLMYDSAVQPNVRLNATKALLQQVNTYLPSEPGLVLPEPAEIPAQMHKNAQDPEPSDAHPGRNDQCPCGSGIKFKRCCLNKSGVNGVTGVKQSIPPAETSEASKTTSHQPPPTSPARSA
jgi:DNA-binding CsgD family transcriptional regulator